MTNAREPSATRIRQRNDGSANFAAASAARNSTAVAMNTLRIRVFIFPNSRVTARFDTSWRNVAAKTAAGIAKKAAKLVSGWTAPSSDGSTYLGTSHRPTNALRQSAARAATKIISEYHQKSPIFAWSLLSSDGRFSFM